MDFKTKIYSVTKAKDRLTFLIGYSCKSKSKDHFIRHLGYRFKRYINMSMLNNAIFSNEITIDILDKFPEKNETIRPVSKKLINEYWSNYGYVLELNNGSIDTPVIGKLLFVSEEEAREWKVENIE